MPRENALTGFDPHSSRIQIDLFYLGLLLVLFGSQGWTNVVMLGGLAQGEKFLVHGGSSGIGTIAIQLAKMRGAQVFATAGSDDKCAACFKLGVEAAFN